MSDDGNPQRMFPVPPEESTPSPRQVETQALADAAKSLRQAAKYLRWAAIALVVVAGLMLGVLVVSYINGIESAEVAEPAPR